MPAARILCLELACKARSRATRNTLLSHALTNKTAAYATLLGPGDAGMLHKYLSAAGVCFVCVLYFIFHSYLSLQFYAALDDEILLPVI